MFRSFSLCSFASQTRQRVDVCSVMERTPTNDAYCTKAITLGMDETAYNGRPLNLKQNDSSAPRIRPPHDMGCPETNSHNISLFDCVGIDTLNLARCETPHPDNPDFTGCENYIPR